MKERSYYNFFVCFANKSKFGIILLLKEKPMCVGEISEKTGNEQSAVSHNLKKLAECHIVDVKQNGKERIYSINKETVGKIMNIAEAHVKKNCMNMCVCKNKCWRLKDEQKNRKDNKGN